MSEALEKRIAALERKMGQTAEPTQGKSTLAAEIDDLERRLSAGYMDDDMEMGIEDELGMDELGIEDELGMDELGIEDEPGMMYMDEDEIFEDVIVEPAEAEEMVELTMDDVATDELGCAQASDEREASLTRPGIEDQITQDYLDEVAELRPGAAELETAPSMLDVAPTGYTARLVKASARLDKVAELLEKNGRKELAFRVDKISDAIEARIKGGHQ